MSLGELGARTFRWTAVLRLAAHELALHGPRARQLIGLAGVSIGDLLPLASVAASLFGFPVIIWRDDPCGVPGYHLLMETSAARAVWANLLANFSRRGDAEYEDGDLDGDRDVDLQDLGLLLANFGEQCE